MKVVVAGTAFGRVYLDAVRSASERFELAGIFARGSDFSRDLAKRYRVPLLTTVDEVPMDVDIACVVVRSAVTGGPGTELAQAFLARGTHVLQEHPVHADDIATCLRTARRSGASYAVNTLYPEVRPIKQFLAAAEVLRERQGLRFVDAVCNSQVAYPLIDVLGRLTGGLRPWAFGECATGLGSVAVTAQPFRSLHAVIGGVPVTLRVQNQVHPDDPDNHSFLMHRVSVGCDAGVLTLADTHGPVLWNARMHSPRDETGRLVMSGPGTERLDVASTTVVGDEEPGTFHQVFARLWPDAVVSALDNLCRDIDRPTARVRSGQWAMGVSRAWGELTARLGVPELIRPPAPEPIPVRELIAAARLQ